MSIFKAPGINMSYKYSGNTLWIRGQDLAVSCGITNDKEFKIIIKSIPGQYVNYEMKEIHLTIEGAFRVLNYSQYSQYLKNNVENAISAFLFERMKNDYPADFYNRFINLREELDNERRGLRKIRKLVNKI